MGIGITSNESVGACVVSTTEFQSPMGIGITSNQPEMVGTMVQPAVSIPNGDRHYLEPNRLLRFQA